MCQLNAVGQIWYTSVNMGMYDSWYWTLMSGGFWFNLWFISDEEWYTIFNRYFQWWYLHTRLLSIRLWYSSIYMIFRNLSKYHSLTNDDHDEAGKQVKMFCYRRSIPLGAIAAYVSRHGRAMPQHCLLGFMSKTQRSWFYYSPKRQKFP